MPIPTSGSPFSDVVRRLEQAQSDIIITSTSGAPSLGCLLLAPPPHHLVAFNHFTMKVKVISQDTMIHSSARKERNLFSVDHVFRSIRTKMKLIDERKGRGKRASELASSVCQSPQCLFISRKILATLGDSLGRILKS